MIATEEMTCKELVELVTEYLEGKLSRHDRARFEAHLAECDGCVNHVGQMRRTIEMLGFMPEESLSPKAESALLSAFRDWKAGL